MNNAQPGVTLVMGAEQDARSFARPPQGHTAVLFDLDGTLLDSVELIVQSYTHAVTTHLGGPVDRDGVLATIGLPLGPILEALAPGQGALLLETYRAYMSEHHDRMARLFPGAGETLRALRARGYQLGIVTSKSRASARLAFDLFALETLVDVTVCFDEVSRPKPAPDPLLAAAARLGVAPAACLYVGDTPHDMQAAQAAGMCAVAAPWGAGTHTALLAAAPGLWLATLADLLDHCPAVDGSR
ncbi:MAG: HAD family hydrolase [Thermomicrobiales bacterium]